MSELQPLDDKLRALFDAERSEQLVPDSLRAHVLRGLEHAVLLTPLAAAPAPGGLIGQGVAAAGYSGKAMALVAALAFGAGASAGAFATRVPAAPPVAAPTKVAPEAYVSPVTTLPDSSVTADAAFSPPAVAPTPARPPAAIDKAAAGPSALAEERELLDMGRAALARGLANDALLAATRHAAKFPKGQLAEEREVLRIQSLRLASRSEEADKLAARFRAQYPNSLYTAAVDAVRQK